MVVRGAASLLVAVAVAAGGGAIADGVGGRPVQAGFVRLAAKVTPAVRLAAKVTPAVRVAAKVTPAPVPRGNPSPEPQICPVADGTCSLKPCVVFVASAGKPVASTPSPGLSTTPAAPGSACSGAADPPEAVPVESVPLRSPATPRAAKSRPG